MTLREYGMRHQAVAIINLILTGFYILYFYISSLGAAFSQGDLARGVDLADNLIFVIFLYTLLAAPIAASVAFLALRQARLSLMVMLSPVVVMSILIIADILMRSLVT